MPACTWFRQGACHLSACNYTPVSALSMCLPLPREISTNRNMQFSECSRASTRRKSMHVQQALQDMMTTEKGMLLTSLLPAKLNPAGVFKIDSDTPMACQRFPSFNCRSLHPLNFMKFCYLPGQGGHADGAAACGGSEGAGRNGPSVRASVQGFGPERCSLADGRAQLRRCSRGRLQACASGARHQVRVMPLNQVGTQAAAFSVTFHTAPQQTIGSTAEPAHLEVHAAKHARPAALLHIVADCGPGQSDIRLGDARVDSGRACSTAVTVHPCSPRPCSQQKHALHCFSDADLGRIPALYKIEKPKSSLPRKSCSALPHAVQKPGALQKG